MPLAVRQELSRQLQPYRVQHASVRWTRPESWHLTLLFLGSVAVGRTSELVAVTDAVAAVAAGPYDVRLGRGDGRERKSDGVAWLGLDRGAGRLIETAQAVAAQCPAGITLGAPPKRAPSAHLTVVRHADAAVIESLRAWSCGPLRVEWRVDRIVLMRSHPNPGGANHETLHESAL